MGPDLIEVVKMHHREWHLRDGLVRPADRGVTSQELFNWFPDASYGEECEQDEHDDPVHPAAAVGLPPKDMPDRKVKRNICKFLLYFRRLFTILEFL